MPEPSRRGRRARVVCLVTGAPLCRNPRVAKEADALTATGYEVVVLGPALSRDLSAEDASLARAGGWRHQVTADVSGGTAGSARTRLRRRLAGEVVRRFGVQAPDALGYGVRATLAAARRVSADLFIGHQEVGLWVAVELARRGRRAGVDFEDWYSADLLPEARTGRPVRLLQALESTALRTLSHVTTTSRALAAELGRVYAAPEPHVIYNGFPWAERRRLGGRDRDRRDRSRPSLHWVSQTVGAGRGLETLFAALASVRTPVELHLRGQCSAEDARTLRESFPSGRGHVLFLHPLVPNDELLERIAEHDVGLALERHEPPSRKFTVTNKILHYLSAGLAVVATDTPGQQEVAAQAGDAVRLCRADDPTSLAAAIEELAASAGARARAQRAALRAAELRFCWEQQACVLVELVARAITETERPCARC